MSQPDLQQVKKALLDAGIEIYRSGHDAVMIAERVRLHIMDAGVSVRLADGLAVEFTVRSQRSDDPSADVDQLFARVRTAAGDTAQGRGYAEAHADTVNVTDPVDETKVLDIWHEITYRKAVVDLDELVAEVRWALDVEKYITP